jgi:hypothetical protein
MKFPFLVLIFMFVLLAIACVRCSEFVDSQENINNSSFLARKCRRGYYLDVRDKDRKCRKVTEGTIAYERNKYILCSPIILNSVL